MRSSSSCGAGAITYAKPAPKSATAISVMRILYGRIQTNKKPCARAEFPLDIGVYANLLLGILLLFDDRTNLCRYYRCGTVRESNPTSTNNRDVHCMPAVFPCKVDNAPGNLRNQSQCYIS